MIIRGSRAIGLGLAVCLAATAGMQLSSVAFADSSVSSQYFMRMNQERAEHGRAALTWRADLADVAQGWAQHMASTQELAHNPGLARQVHNWQVLGENVGVGPTLDDLDRAFMASTEHRDNILDSDYTDVGVGSVSDDKNIWIVIDFREPQVPESQPTPAHSSAPVEHWVRGATVAPTVDEPRSVARRNLIAMIRFRSDLPFAPGCILRFGWL
jgi:hypothetical protein